MKTMLVGCEFSGVVKEAFRKKGWDSWSCCLTEGKGENHIVGDVVEVVKSRQWDLIILHPPCTALSLSGNGTYGKGKPKHYERLKALEWTKKLWELAKLHSPRVAVEQPASTLGNAIGKRTQTIQPWEYGHDENKKTFLWLHGLPRLNPTNIVPWTSASWITENRINNLGNSAYRAIRRSITYQGIADAMADQWTE